MKVQKIIYLVLAILFLATAVYRFIDYRINKNFFIYSAIPCNPAVHSCFLELCEDDVECEQVPYSKIEISAKVAPTCILENSCEELSCNDVQNCEIIYCTDESLEDYEDCTSLEF